MVHTTIESIDSTGEKVVPEAELKRRVARAAELLEKELEAVETFPVESRWRIVHQPGSPPRVSLDLVSDGVGIRDWQFGPSDLADDAHVRQSLPWPMSAFGRVLSTHLRRGVGEVLRDLKKLASTPLITTGE